MFHDRELSVSILSWGGSFIFHGLVILGTLAFLTHVTPTPASKLVQWKVSVVTPRPSFELSEHVQTVKHTPQPTTRSTVSRPQPKRHSSQQRRIQQRQPSIHQTAVVTRPTPQPINNHTLVKAMLSHSRPSQQSLPKPVTQIQTTTAPTRQVISTTQVMAKAPPTFKKPHLNRKEERQTVTVAQPQVISSTAETHSAKSRMQIKSKRTSTNSGAIIQTRYRHKSQSIEVTKQFSDSSIKRHHKSQQASSVIQQRVPPMLTQQSIFTGSPKQQPTQKKHQHIKRTSISREATRHRKKQHSDDNQVSKGLSEEALAFLKLLREKIEKHRQYPRIAKRMGYQGTTTVSFALSHAGNLTLLKIAEPSGHAVLDKAALEAVQSIATLKPPMTIGGTPIEIPVAFELTR